MVSVVVLAFLAGCLLTHGCATAKEGKLTADELAILRKTKTVLIVTDGVDGERREFFVNPFKEQLIVNGVIPVTDKANGIADSDYDAVISLKCYYLDFGQFDLNRSTDLNFGHGPKSATGVGKRIGCRFRLSHKGLGELFDGQIQGTTKLGGRMDPAEFETATSKSDAFSSFLERNAQQKYDAELKRSPGWLYVLNMRPQD
jgi:hypothetical protein